MANEQATRNWTRLSYDAIHQWAQGGARKISTATLHRCGLSDVVAELETADNLGVWYALCREAAETVGPNVVARSARRAESELAAIAKATA